MTAEPDEAAIIDLQVDYCRYLDEMNLDALADLFTEDAATDYGDEDWLHAAGRTMIRTSLERMWRFTRTSHHLSNAQVRFGGADSARGVSSVIAWHELPDGTEAIVYGRYHLTFRRIAEGWRISTLRFAMTGNSAGYTADLHRSERAPVPAGWSGNTSG